MLAEQVLVLPALPLYTGAENKYRFRSRIRN